MLIILSAKSEPPLNMQNTGKQNTFLVPRKSIAKDDLPEFARALPYGIILPAYSPHRNSGDVVELADTQHLGCCAARLESSILSVPTIIVHLLAGEEIIWSKR